MRRPLLPALLPVAATAFWAGNIVVGAALVGRIDPLSLLFWRWSVAVVPLIVVAAVLERPDWRALLRAWWRLLLLAMCGMIGYALLMYSALQHTDAINASLVNAFNPALIALAAALFLRERLRILGGTGIVLALAGVLVVLTGGRMTELFALRGGLGDLLMLGAIAVWTLYTLLGRTVRSLPPITSTAAQAVLALTVLTPTVLLTGLRVPADPGAVAGVAFIGLFPSMLSYLFWNRGVAALGAGRAAVYMNLITLFTVVISVALGASLSWPQLAGGGLIVAGVLLTSVSSASPRRAAARAAVEQQPAHEEEPVGQAPGH